MEYAAPRTIAEVVRLLSEPNGRDCRVLAGGTDLVVQMSGGARRPDRVVDIKNVPELGRIVESPEGFRIGAAVSAATITEHAGLGAAWPGVVEAIELIGSMQVQGRATPVGNLCNASPAADSVPALIAADARVVVVGPNGERELAVADVPSGPGRTCLERDEFVVGLKLPPRPARGGDAYVRFTPRSEMDIAVVGAAVAISLDPDGLCASARVALGAVAPTALLVREAGEALVGTRLDDATLEAASAAVRRACRPIDDKRGTAAYRIRISGVIFARAAAAALVRARG